MKSNKNRELSEYEMESSKENQQSFQNSLCVKKEKRIKLKLKKERIYKQKTHGPWTKEEEEKFMNYMKTHLEIFESKNLRRRKKVFRQMAKFLKTRSSQQCRSHHQKYQQRFYNSHNIIIYLEQKLMQIGDNIMINPCKVSQSYLDNYDNFDIKGQVDDQNVVQLADKTKKKLNDQKTTLPTEKTRIYSIPKVKQEFINSY